MVAVVTVTVAVVVVLIGVLPEIGVDVLSDVNVESCAVVMTVLDFTLPTSLEEFSC